MSCNGCRILRKGCNENCVLRQSLEGIDSPQAQANATVFVAKFFGRAGLMSFLSSVPESQRPALFQSLLFEACGRTINPVNGAVGLLGTGNWHACQAAVNSVLRGGVPRPLAEFRLDGTGAHKDDLRDSSMRLNKRKLGHDDHNIDHDDTNHLDLGLTAGLPARITARGRIVNGLSEKHRPASPSDESETTTLESCFVPGDQRDGHGHDDHETKLLRLFF